MPWDYDAQTFERWVRRSTRGGIDREPSARIGEGLTAIDHQDRRVYTVVLGWLAGLFAVMAAMLALTAAVVGWPVLLLAVPLAAVAYAFWYHASGRLTERLREQARRRTVQGNPGSRRERRAAATNTGPRGVGFGQQAAGRQAGGRQRRRGNRRRRRRPPEPPTQTEMSPATARGVLGVAADADTDAVRSAYRSKVKDVHPDRGGSTEAFKRVNEAYETLGGAEA